MSDERDMSAHIPEGTDKAKKEASGGIDPDDRDMSAKTNDLGDGIHPTSVTFGQVVSDNETDAAGLTPQAMAERADKSSGDDKSSDSTTTKSSTSK
jgi:hypothetical protein